MVVYKGKQVLALVKCPLIRSKLAEQGVINLKHIHAVKARIKSLVTFIVGNRMQHGIIHPLVIIAVQGLTNQEEIRFQSITQGAQTAQEIMIQTVSNVEPQSVDIKFVVKPGKSLFKPVEIFGSRGAGKDV